jgi:hypothetical protein
MDPYLPFDDVKSLDNIEEESKIKKFIIILISSILIILILSYLLISYPIFPLLESLLESNKAKDHTVYLKNTTIHFSNELYKELQHRYLTQTTEFVLCLTGNLTERTYFLNHYYEPKILTSTFSKVTFEPCINDTLVIIHSHPSGNCIGSQRDILSLEDLQKKNKNALIVIMCGKDRFTIYPKN